MRGYYQVITCLDCSNTQESQSQCSNTLTGLAQALMQALLLYAHERLQLGQRAEDIFASLFAKQQTAMAR